MRLLLDESLPRGLKRLLRSHVVSTVQEQGWAGTSNGELLRLAGSSFDIFVTADQNLEYQQNLRGYEIGVVVLAARSTRIADLEPLVPLMLELQSEVKSGEVQRVAL